MQQAGSPIKITSFWRWLPALLLVSAMMIPVPAAWAAFGKIEEKPQPVFSAAAGKIVAKLIPRGKSTSIQIGFSVEDATLVSVKGMDFEAAKRPGANIKDFRSALFVITARLPAPGAAAKIVLESDYFTSSTGFWVYNRNLPQPWVNAAAENISRPERIQQLVVTVKDGGKFDTDGAVNGRIVVVGGPKDSFWGYALGTLFIRFFGIFLVLSVLMIGMMLSGKIFQLFIKKPTPAAAAPQPAKAPQPEAARAEPDAELAAAVALALHLHFELRRTPAAPPLPRPSVWAQQGRAQIMAGRLLTLHRRKK